MVCPDESLLFGFALLFRFTWIRNCGRFQEPSPSRTIHRSPGFMQYRPESVLEVRKGGACRVLIYQATEREIMTASLARTLVRIRARIRARVRVRVRVRVRARARVRVGVGSTQLHKQLKSGELKLEH